MARFIKPLYITVFIFFAFQLLSPSSSHPLFRRAVEESGNKSKANESEKLAPCLEERNGIYPCSSTISGNLLLMVFYGAILGVAAKCISDGAELLLDIGVPAAIVGGIVLPLLGAVPDSAIIIVSGLGDDAQSKLSIGMGTLAGSTIMLLTAAWAGSVFIGRCDIDRKGEAIEGTGTGKLSLTKQGVTVLPDVVTAVVIMLGTSLSYFIVQGADWYFGPHNFGPQPPYVRKAALATMIICFILFVFYLGFLAYDSKAAERRADKHRQSLIQRRVLHRFVLMASKETGHERIGGDEYDSPEDIKAKEDHIQSKYFKAWHLGSGMRSKSEGTEKDPILSKDHESITDDEKEEHEEPEHEESRSVLTMKSIGLLVLGVGLVTIFADPMCDVLDSLTNPLNHSHIPISSFYVSFVVTPLCSNASELVSSLIFASKKKKENVSMTFSQLYGASTMNNTLCLGIFAALVVFRNLRWYYSAEVTVIVLVQWVVGFAGLRYTYKIWMGMIVGSMYIISILFIALLESKAIGWK
ncbi:sodium/calcium exchanger NCL1-like isoform X2 [Actinia tenebrosa]|uniref:Sodium/calcium exchanger NCL1-like isoform X2 n=1 Tax=Actinia tenebrosa TaxID=6105 RepID=A0A6P8HX32_ACTTE|nr:sodium/calcium exchanger NCL1-like isoform X2 [Actinia tenebrosa]